MNHIYLQIISLIQNSKIINKILKLIYWLKYLKFYCYKEHIAVILYKNWLKNPLSLFNKNDWTKEKVMKKHL